MPIIGVIHPGYGPGTVISMDKISGTATVRYDDPPGRNPAQRGGVVPTGQVRLTEHRLTVDGQTGFMRGCPDCGVITPHKLTDTGVVCGVCGLETKREKLQDGNKAV
jgi:hypothetical protein